MQSNRFGTLSTIALLVGAWLTPSALAQGAGSELTVQATDFESADGHAIFVLLSNAEAFEKAREENGQDRSKWRNHHAVADAPIQQGVAAARFVDLKPGDYAVMVFHDSNGNQKLDRKPGFMGRQVPAEDLGITNDYRIGFPPRPPSWNEIKIAVQPGANRTTLKMGMMRR